MPGIFGYYQRSTNGCDPATAVEAMAAGAAGQLGQKLGSYSQGPFALQNRVLTPEPAGSLGAPPTKARVFLDGYLLECQRLFELLERWGRPVDFSWSDQVLVEQLYAVLGEGITEYLNGVYNLCVYHPDTRQLKLLNCRVGARHLFYRCSEKFFAFATEAKVLAALGDSPLAVNRLALCDMFNFGYLSGDQTLFADIHLLESSTVLRLDATGLERQKYWDFAFANSGEGADCDRLVEEGGHLLGQAVERYQHRFGRIGIPLSGGLDSRAILAFAAGHGPAPPVYHCAWYGREERIARRLAEVCGGEWNCYDPLAFDVAQMVKTGMAHTDGNVHCHQFWFLPIVQELSRRGAVEILLDGYLLDVFFGDTFLVLPQKRTYSTEDKIGLVNGLWRRGNPHFARGAFLPQFYREYQEANRASIVAQMEGIDEPDISNYIQRFSFANRSNRYSAVLPNLMRQWVEYGFPGLDRDLIDFYLRLPPRFKREARFYRALQAKAIPAVAQVPWAKTGRPLDRDKGIVDKLLDRRLPLRQLGSGALLRLSRGRLDYSHRADLNRHFRQDSTFRGFFTQILLDKRTHSRGIVDKRGAQRLIEAVDRGWPVMTLIQSLVTVEFWLREYIDGKE